MAKDDGAETVRIDRDGDDDRVASVVLDRPDRYNAFDVATVRQLRLAVEQVGRDDAVRAVVLAGEGKAFCAGGDTHEMRAWLDGGKDAGSGEGPDQLFYELTRHLHAAIVEVRRMQKPVVAAVHGAAAGGGFGLALSADLRVAGEAAFFLPAYFKIGVVPDGGVTYFLPRLVGHGRASDILLRDRRVEAEEALRIGLVDEVHPTGDVRDRALAVAAELAAGPPLAIARAKALLHESLDRGLEAQLEAERRDNAWSATTGDFREGLTAYHDKRDPNFEGR